MKRGGRESRNDVTRGAVVRAVVALLLAAAFIETGAAKLPIVTHSPDVSVASPGATFGNDVAGTGIDASSSDVVAPHTTAHATPIIMPHGAIATRAASSFPLFGQRLQDAIHPPHVLPVFVYSEPTLAPIFVEAKKRIRHDRDVVTRVAKRVAKRGLFDRAPVGEKIHVTLTQYCLQGTTRRDHYVREGIVAADPRVFPLARYVEIFVGRHYLGRYLVDDTGAKVKGPTLDIWNPSCSDARRFGRRRGTATLVAKGAEGDMDRQVSEADTP